MDTDMKDYLSCSLVVGAVRMTFVGDPLPARSRHKRWVSALSKKMERAEMGGARRRVGRLSRLSVSEAWAKPASVPYRIVSH